MQIGKSYTKTPNTMTPIDYLSCFFIATIGSLLQAALYLKNVQAKAQLANVAFDASTYFKKDWLSIVVSMLTIMMFLMLIGEAIKIKPEIVNYIKFGFSFIGYFSQDIASRLFGAMNKKVNDVIDRKTTISDQTTGEDKPTPTA